MSEKPSTVELSSDSRCSQCSQDLGWQYGRWGNVFASLNKEGAALSVAKLRQAHPTASNDQLARRIVKHSARVSSILGVICASPALIPWIGTAVALAGVLPEEMYLVRYRCLMILKIATVYGFNPTKEERLLEIIALAGPSSKVSGAITAFKDDFVRASAKAAAIINSQAKKKALVGIKVTSRGIVRKLPVFGILVGGAINSISLKRLGRKSIQFYKRLREKSTGEGSVVELTSQTKRTQDK